jgi:hypothetical protein
MSDTRRKIATLSKLAAVLSIEVDWAPLLRFSCDNCEKIEKYLLN